MCVMSMVHDEFAGRLANQGLMDQGWTGVPNWLPKPELTAEDITALRQLVVDFREAVAAAKVVDRLTGQPDCVDPEKAKLEERVTELETRLTALEAWKNA